MFMVRRPGHAASAQARRPGLLTAGAVVSVGVLALSSCGAGGGSRTGAGGDTSPVGASTQPSTGSSPESRPVVRVTSNVGRGAQNVPVDKVVTVKAAKGQLKHVVLTGGKSAIAGKVAADGRSWTAADLLEPATAYTIKATAVGADGRRTTTTSRFHTQALTLDQQTYPSVAPLNGETVGVGMPVIVTFDVPVTDKAAFERHMHVDTQPAQEGSWYWLSDTEAHWRPKTYWKAGTTVSVHVDVNSISAGHGVYGQESRDVTFHIGDAHIYKVNAQTDQMKVFSNGKLLRTVPVTTGKPGFVTRSGTKVIIEKFPVKRMDSETIGIGKNNPNYYNIDNVQWAMRMTYSGEFLHAAPWSVASQGHANVSHGCTGMSTANADWIYHMTLRGDVVETTGTGRPMEFGNGYGDWNISYQDYKSGSALS